MTETPTQVSSVPALEKGMDILEFLADQKDPISLQEISAGLHRSRGEIYRMVAWLVERQYVVRCDGQDKYVLGERMARLFRKQPSVEDIISLAMPLMTRISETVSAACYLSVRSEASSVVIASVDSPDFYSVTAKIGTVAPLRDCPAGASLVHGLSPSELHSLFANGDAEKQGLFADEREFFNANGFVKRYQSAGPGVLEVAVAGPVHSRIVSAITATKIVSSPDEQDEIVAAIKKIVRQD